MQNQCIGECVSAPYSPSLWETLMVEESQFPAAKTRRALLADPWLSARSSWAELIGSTFEPVLSCLLDLDDR